MRPKGTKAELEARRRRAVAMLHEGRTLSEVARLVGVSPSSVFRWRAMYQRVGEEGLQAKRHPGRKPKLSARQRQRLAKLLLKGPRSHGYRTELWTLARVAEVIEEHFGVLYHPSNVWRMLRAMDWSCQKPQRRARERDEEAIQQWRRQEWPRIKKSPQGAP